MMGSIRVAMLLASVSCAVYCAVPKCDPAVTSKMSHFHPNGLPMHVIQTLNKHGLFSYVVVSSVEGRFLGLNVRCIGISMPDIRTAQVSYKLSIFPKINLKFPIREDKGILFQQDGQEFKLYVIYLSDAGVILTYRCCDECTSTAPNVGIAVADILKNNATTLAAFTVAKAKMVELGWDNDIVDLPFCS